MFVRSLFVVVVLGILATFNLTYGQEEGDTVVLDRKRKLIDTLTYETQTGLPIAASKIYFTDSKFTFSGFGESNFVNYRGPKNTESNDLELYYTNLQRFVAYAAWKPVNWLVVYAEFFAEFLNDGANESEFEYLPEFFLDFLIDKKFNVRVGTHQPGIGFINNNDEPVMFYTVNRPEVERIIIPSQWIDLGLTTYGQLTDDLKWSLGIFQGLDANNLNGSTFLRRGRADALRFNFNSFLLNSKLIYTGFKDTEISASGFWTRLGDNQQVHTSDGMDRVRSNTLMLSSYIRHTYRNWSFMALGSYGRVNDTDKLYALTQDSPIGPQVIGEEVYGVYGEVSYNILPALGWVKKSKSEKDNVLVKRSEFALPVFARIERLNTHAGIHENLQGIDRAQTNLTTLTVGANFNPRRNIVIKSNYQFRWNDEPLLDIGEYEGNRFEFGLGFIF